MTSSALLKLPDMLRRYGVTVIEMPGWRDREVDGVFTPIAILDHHDAMGLHNRNVPANMIRPGQYGSQLWIGHDGVVCMMAAGRMPHAGVGPGWGAITQDGGNRLCVGNETDYSGTGPWPAPLLITWRIVRFCEATLLGITADQVQGRLAGHKEYAPNRKIDPGNYSMAQARAELALDLRNGYPPGFAPTTYPPKPTTPPADPTDPVTTETDTVMQTFFTYPDDNKVTRVFLTDGAKFVHVQSWDELKNQLWAFDRFGIRPEYITDREFARKTVPAAVNGDYQAVAEVIAQAPWVTDPGNYGVDVTPRPAAAE